MRTVTLELLRHGSAHNQLLSNLTPYLALCQNHEAVTVHVPYDHNQFLHRLKAFDYQDDASSRQFTIDETARELGAFLGTIPGLTAELSRHESENEDLTHLQLIISSSELALLPFELALASQGFPGASQPLFLQGQSPICLTREVRRVAEPLLDWPETPRILFAFATPSSFTSIPVEAHLLALRQAIEPWHGLGPTTADQITVLPNASAASLEKACAENEFTHVHLLAHGHEVQEGYDIRFGLALDDGQGGVDLISGRRLSTILRPSRQGCSSKLARPMVVTLASCHGGGQGSIVGAGGSIAHALHTAGIPIVIASQFPLTFEGSVIMVETLYQRLLWGDDPRELLTDLRRRLHSQLPSSHDWASIVAYTTLPSVFGRQLANLERIRSKKSCEQAKKNAESLIAKFSAGPQDNQDVTLADLENVIEKNQAGMDRLKKLIGNNHQRLSEIHGLLGSANKQQAEIYHIYAQLLKNDNDERYEPEVHSLKQALKNYKAGFIEEQALPWNGIQMIILELVLDRLKRKEWRISTNYQRLAEDWTLCKIVASRKVSKEKNHWALCDLIQLYLTFPLIESESAPKEIKDHEGKALDYAKQLAEKSDLDNTFVISSMKRELRRYVDWYPKIAEIGSSLPMLAKKLLREFN